MKLYPIMLAGLLIVFPAVLSAQKVFSLKKCIETGLERNYSIRIVKNEQQISENNATLGNAGFLPTADMSGGFFRFRRRHTQEPGRRKPGKDKRCEFRNGQYRTEPELDCFRRIRHTSRL